MCRTITPQIWLVPVLHTPAISCDWWRGQGRQKNRGTCIYRRDQLERRLCYICRWRVSQSYSAPTEEKQQLNKFHGKKWSRQHASDLTGRLWMWPWPCSDAWLACNSTINPGNRRVVSLLMEGPWQFVQHSVAAICMRKQIAFILFPMVSWMEQSHISWQEKLVN